MALMLNSAAFHGINSDAKDINFREYEHGRVSDRTIDAILAKLPTGEKKLRLLITHHHFYKNERILNKDYSVMINGTKLLELLTRRTGSCWFILHGHQHYPEISYGRGDTSAPIIFSAGSFSRRLNELGRESANQFYHIHFPLDRYSSLDWEACGTCRAWDWVPDDGWKPARGIARIPMRAGFGCRSSHLQLADRISQVIDAKVNKVAQWEDVVAEVPDLQFVLPSDLDRVVATLGVRGLTVYGQPFSGKCQIASG